MALRIIPPMTELEPYSYLRQRQAVRTVIPTPEPSRWSVLCSPSGQPERASLAGRGSPWLYCQAEPGARPLGRT